MILEILANFSRQGFFDSLVSGGIQARKTNEGSRKKEHETHTRNTQEEARDTIQSKKQETRGKKEERLANTCLVLSLPAMSCRVGCPLSGCGGGVGLVLPVRAGCASTSLAFAIHNTCRSHKNSISTHKLVDFFRKESDEENDV